MAARDEREDLPIQLTAEEVADLYEAELTPTISALTALQQADLHARLAEARAAFKEERGREPRPEETDLLVASVFQGLGLVPDPERLRHRIARYAVGKAVRAMAEWGYVEIAGPSAFRAREKLFESDGSDLPAWIKPAFVVYLRSYFLSEAERR